jgi:Nucleotidyl transferase AbiEii toxin, Type IV TA system
MTKQPNIAASVKARLLNIAKEQQQPFDVVLIRYALERLIYRLGISPYAERYILKGGLLVSLWLEDAKRQTRDADFLGSGDASEAYLVKVFTEIMQIEAEDALRFDTAKLTATAIREECVSRAV